MKLLKIYYELHPKTGVVLELLSMCLCEDAELEDYIRAKGNGFHFYYKGNDIEMCYVDINRYMNYLKQNMGGGVALGLIGI